MIDPILQLEKYQQLTEQSGNEREYMQQQTKLAQEINLDQMRQIEELKEQNSLMSEKIVELSTLEPVMVQPGMHCLLVLRTPIGFVFSVDKSTIRVLGQVTSCYRHSHATITALY